MSIATVALLASWITLTATPPVEPRTAGTSVAKQESTDAWVKRLTRLRDHMHTAFGVGPDLTLLDPDQGVEIVRQAWPQIQEADVKTGLLKTFAFSKALPHKHPRLFQVLDLGLNDPDPKIRAYAAIYLREYSGVDFTNAPAAYQKWFDQFGDKSPGDMLALQAAGGAEQAAVPERALSASQKVAEAEALTKEGWQLWSQTFYGQAENKFAAAVALDPAAKDAWNGLGWSRFNGGEARSAVEAFENCLAIAPKHPGALNGLGQIALNDGDYPRAEKYLKQAAPQASAAWFGLARLYLLTGKYTAAERWITKARNEQPNDRLLEQMLAAAKDKKLPNELQQRLEPSGRQVGNETDTLNAQGWREFFSGDYPAAEQTFRNILKTSPDHLAALNGLGFSLLNQGHVAEAKPYFEKILAKEPHSPGPANGLARCLKAEGKLDEAIAIWEDAYKDSPGSNDITANLAMAYLEKGEKAKAIQLLEVMVKADPDNEQLKQTLAKARNNK